MYVEFSYIFASDITFNHVHYQMESRSIIGGAAENTCFIIFYSGSYRSQTFECVWFFFFIIFTNRTMLQGSQFRVTWIQGQVFELQPYTFNPIVKKSRLLFTPLVTKALGRRVSPSEMCLFFLNKDGVYVGGVIVLPVSS